MIHIFIILTRCYVSSVIYKYCWTFKRHFYSRRKPHFFKNSQKKSVGITRIITIDGIVSLPRRNLSLSLSISQPDEMSYTLLSVHYPLVYPITFLICGMCLTFWRGLCRDRRQFVGARSIPKDRREERPTVTKHLAIYARRPVDSFPTISCAYTHACKHARTHMQTHAHTHAHLYTYSCVSYDGYTTAHIRDARILLIRDWRSYTWKHIFAIKTTTNNYYRENVYSI